MIEDVTKKWKKEGWSIRRVANVSNMAYSTLRWLVTKPVSKLKHKVTEQDKDRVRDFFKRSDVTMKLPLK